MNDHFKFSIQNMEKATVKSKNRIFNFLPKVAQASDSFKSPPPFSPADRAKWPDLNVNNLSAKINKGISGNSETQEPTSPKVSCMGQIKHRNKICKNKRVSLQKEFDVRPVSSPGPKKNNKTTPDRLVPELNKKPEGIRNVFTTRRRSDASIHHAKPLLTDRTPSLGEMLRFASSRDSLANFDFTTARIAPEELDVDFNSDKEKGYSDEEYDTVTPVTAALLVSGSGAGLTLEPRKEINLWKRRNMARPKPLQLNLIRTQ